MNKLFNEMFESYSEALGKLLEHRKIEQKWLAEKILKKGEKFESKQQQISRWIRTGANVSEGYQHRINNALDVVIKQEKNGLWAIYAQSDSEGVELETKEAMILFDRIKEYASSSDSEQSGNLNKKVLLAFRDQLISQRAQTSSMIQLLDTLLEDG